MKRFLQALSLGSALLFSPSLHASTLSFQSNFLSDDQVMLFQFSTGTSGTVTLRTFGYAGGVDGTGQTITGGGFDPVLTLYDGSGMFLQTNDDAACGVVGKDAATQNCFDARISLSLAAGTYTLALTEADNLPQGNLSDSFSQVGNGNFTCPEFLGRAGAFCDASPSQRGSSYEVEIRTPDAAVSPVPEPASLLLSVTGCVLMFCVRRRRQPTVQF